MIATHRIHERWFKAPKGNLSWCSFIFFLGKTATKENTSNREMRADVGHERRRCLIKQLMSVVRVQIVQIIIAIIVSFLSGYKNRNRPSYTLLLLKSNNKDVHYLSGFITRQNLVRAGVWIDANSNIFPFYFHIKQTPAAEGVLWHQPCPIFQSQFSRPDVLSAGEENQTIDITKKAQNQPHLSRAFPPVLSTNSQWMCC